MYKYIFIVFIIFISCKTVDNNSNENQPKNNVNTLQTIYIANVQKGLGADSIPTYKFHKAMNLAAYLTGRYQLLPPKRVDSAVKFFEIQNKKPRALDIANFLNVDKIMFAKLNRLNNMLRVDITLFPTNDTAKITEGKGYDLMNYLDLKTNKMLIDPNLLRATQRAFADAVNDSLIYDTLKGKQKVYPVPTLVISGIAYISNSDSSKWQIYNDRVISSFDICETIFEESRNSQKFVTYDLETRDSIYALFKLYGIENYMPPTNIEVETLRKMEVEYFISGRIEFFEKEANIKLMLFKITSKSQELINQVEGTIKEDKTEKIRKKIRDLTNKLLE